MIAFTCVACGTSAIKLRRRGSMDTCQTCVKKDVVARWRAKNSDRKLELNRAWRAANQDKHRASKSAWQQRNPEKEASKAAAWRKANPERAREIRLRYYANNRDKCIQRVVERTQAARTPPWADKDITASIYELARIYSRALGEPFHVDHIVPLQGKSVCGLHWHGNLQLLTASENRMKSNRLEGNP
jgi:hypothetical protein